MIDRNVLRRVWRTWTGDRALRAVTVVFAWSAYGLSRAIDRGRRDA